MVHINTDTQFGSRVNYMGWEHFLWSISSRTAMPISDPVLDRQTRPLPPPLQKVSSRTLDRDKKYIYIYDQRNLKRNEQSVSVHYKLGESRLQVVSTQQSIQMSYY